MMVRDVRAGAVGAGEVKAIPSARSVRTAC